jgi:unspecific monooxygenase
MQRFRQNPTDPAFVQNPYGFYDRTRQAGELFFWEDFDLACATGHAAVGALLKDRRLGREAPADHAITPAPHTEEFYAIEAHSMLELEPPRHTRLRGLVLRAFTSRRIAALAPEITALCHELIDALPEDAELLSGYAQQVPVIVIARLLGVPDSLAPQLLQWSNAMVGMYQARRSVEMEYAAADAARDFAGFLRNHIAERRETPADDLITHLIAAEEDGARLSTDEMISTCILLLNAGHEATVHTLGNGVKALCEHRAGPGAVTAERIAPTVEEILRFDPPLHMFTRWVYEDVTLFGHDFHRGDKVACLLAAANRDPAVYDLPNQFDPARFAPAHSDRAQSDPAHSTPARRTPPHTAFGAGVHFCVGAPLARLELQIALTCLFARCPDLALAAVPRYADIYPFHGLDRLDVRLGRKPR